MSLEIIHKINGKLIPHPAVIGKVFMDFGTGKDWNAEVEYEMYDGCAKIISKHINQEDE